VRHSNGSGTPAIAVTAALAVLLAVTACTTRGPEPPAAPDAGGDAAAVDASRPTPVDHPLTVRVAAVQCSSELGAVEANRLKLSALVREAAAGGAKFVVLPEAAITGYLSQNLRVNWHVAGRPLESRFEGIDPNDAAETVPGPSTTHFARLADELDVWLTVPLLEADDSQRRARRYFNTVCLMSPDGEMVAHYRKLTPWPYPEKSWAEPGDHGVQTADTPYGRVGLAICFDIHTILDRYEGHDVWTLLYPIAWVSDQHPVAWFGRALPAKAARYGLNVVGANWSVDRPQEWFGYGYSTIIQADGTIAAQAKTREGSEIIYADLPTHDGPSGYTR